MTRRNRRQEVHDLYREAIERTGKSPSCRDAGKVLGMSAVGVWKHVQTLIVDGKLMKSAPLRVGRPVTELALPETIDLSAISTDRLRGELARRGITLDALQRPKLLNNEGRACAANHCQTRVGRGMLMCREHWFQLPPGHRSDIMNAWAGRHQQAFQEALERARDHLGGFTRVVERVA